MSRVIYEYPSGQGPVRVEVEDQSYGPSPVGRPGQPEQVPKSFEEVVAGIRPIAEGILEQTINLARAPKTVEVSFGVKLSGELGVILASTTAEGHVTVKLSWEKGETPGTGANGTGTETGTGG